MCKTDVAVEVEVDEVEAKAQRKAAKRAAKVAAAAAEEEAPVIEKKAKKSKTNVEAEEAVADEVDEVEAKRLRKAAKKAAKEAAAAGAAGAEIETLETPKKKKRAEKTETNEEAEIEDAPKVKKSKNVVDTADESSKKAEPAVDSAKGGEAIFKVFVQGLPFSVDEARLRKDFGECGEIMDFRMPMNEEGKPKGFAFIQYASKEGFDAACKFDKTDYGGRVINVQEAKGGAKGAGKSKDADWICPSCADNVFARNSACRKCGTAKPGTSGESAASSGPIDNVNTVFIRGLPWSVTEELLKKDFAECGEIESSKFPLNEEGKPRGIAFIKFKTSEGVDGALKFDSTDYGGRTINVCKSGEGKGKGGGKGKGKDGMDGKGKGKDKDGKGKGKSKGKGKDKAPSAAFAKTSGCMVEGAGDKKTFEDSDDE